MPDPTDAPATPASPSPTAPPAKSPSAPAKSTAPPAAKPKSPATPKPSTSSTAPASKPAAPAAKPAAAPAKAAPKPAPATKKVEPKKRWERSEEKKPSGPPPKVVDVSGLVLGRAASHLAKRLLQGETIVVVNADRAIVLGGRANVFELYRATVARGSVRKGPHYPRRPDRIFRRTVRGMLPFDHSKGREAWARLMTYVGVPAEFAALPKETIEGAKARPALRPPLTLGEISRHVGGHGPW